MRCNVGGDIIDVQDKPTCDSYGGTIVPESGGGGGGTCLAEVLHRPGKGLGFANFDIASYGQEFRDHILARSERGKKVIQLYETADHFVFEAIRNRPEVLGNVLVVAASLALFSHQMLYPDTPSASKSRFPRSTYESITAVLHGLRLGSENKSFHAVLDEIAPEFRDWLGKSPAEVRKLYLA